MEHSSAYHTNAIPSNAMQMTTARDRKYRIPEGLTRGWN